MQTRKRKAIVKPAEFIGKVISDYKIILKNINAVVFILNRQGRFIYLNDYVEKISHYKLYELLGKPFKKIVAPEFLGMAMKIFKKQLKGINVRPFELAVVDKNRERIYLKTSETIITDNGKTVAVFGIASNITEQKVVTMQLSKMVRDLNLIYRIGTELTSILDLDHLLGRIVRQLKDTFGYEITSIFMIDKAKYELVLKAAEKEYAKKLQHTRIRIGQGITGFVAKTGKAYLSNDVRKDRHYIVVDKKTRSELAVPLIVADNIIGVLNVESYKRGAFGKDDIRILSLIATQAAVAIENSRLYTALQDSYLETVKTLVLALEAKDQYTHGHSERVRKYAINIARKLKLSQQQVKQLDYAGSLHDIGKIGISDQLLTKPSALTVAEDKLIKQHPNIGYKILSHAKHLGGVGEIIRYEHERYDGRGYPNGLRTDKIPIGARIIAVADAYDAMRTDRPYRKALSKKEAIQRLKENAGTQFDPKIVETFLRIISKK